MPSWGEIESLAPDLARHARGLLEAHVHKTIATLRADGSPRISGIESEFTDGELTFGSMPGARKGADLHRDPRFALHGPTVDPPEDDPTGWPGEAKISGRAYFAKTLDGAEGAPGELFRADVDQVVLTSQS